MIRLTVFTVYWASFILFLLSSFFLHFISSDNIILNSIQMKDENLSENNIINSLETNINKKMDINDKQNNNLNEAMDEINEYLELVESSDISTETESKGSIRGIPDFPPTPTVITLGNKVRHIVIEPAEGENEETDINGSLTTNKTSSEQLPNENFQNLENIEYPNSKLIIKETILPQEKIPPDENNLKIQDTGDGEGYLTSENNLAKNESDQIEKFSNKINITQSDENLIPVFSEWAQKQMEEAEKEVVNSSTMKKNITSSTKPQILKTRAKNYASPDCGAKIITSNPEARNTWALLTTSKDEYMLSPCTNRIWFIVELCEPIQAEKIDLANFELFSSSPKNITVGVSNRFPTREWSNVGRFIANDKKIIQSFDLYPHLFGKFVRVDVHSHYNSEHFCPISLFRVYGTSEFEAFETENRLTADDIDEFDDDVDTIEQHGNIKNDDNNLFKSASDAVMSIVKKAAEVLVKKNTNETTNNNINNNKTNYDNKNSEHCLTLRNNFQCDNCNEILVKKINTLISCKYNHLSNILNIKEIRMKLITSNICINKFNLDIENFENDDCKKSTTLNFQRYHINQCQRENYVLSLFPVTYIGAFCQILSNYTFNTKSTSLQSKQSVDSLVNLTLDKTIKLDESTLNILNDQKNNLKLTNEQNINFNENIINTIKLNNTKVISDEIQTTEDKFEKNQKYFEGQNEIKLQTVKQPTKIENHNYEDNSINEKGENINIFNVVENSNTENIVEAENGVKKHLPSDTEEIENKENEVDGNNWENMENILAEPATSANDAINIINLEDNPNINHIPQKVPSESVFIRLSNRIKALERNMSLSGQYLEELSRRYKKQVEELQNSFAKTLLNIDEQNQRVIDKEKNFIEQIKILTEQIDILSTRLNLWITLVICLTITIILLTLISWFTIWPLKRKNIEIINKNLIENLEIDYNSSPNRNFTRRKSLEGVSGHPTPTTKTRRPSEEAMHIGRNYKNIQNKDKPNTLNCNKIQSEILSQAFVKRQKQRNRKMSVLDGKAYYLDDKKQNIEVNRKLSAPADFYPPHKKNLQSIQNNDQILIEENYENYIPDGSSYNLINSCVNKKNHNKIQEKISLRKSKKQKFLNFPKSSSDNYKGLVDKSTAWEWCNTDNFKYNKVNKNNIISKQNGEKLIKSKSESPENLTNETNGFNLLNKNHLLNGSSEYTIFSSSNDSNRTSDGSVNSSILSSCSTCHKAKKHNSFKKMVKKFF